jgi:hypothetical protein
MLAEFSSSSVWVLAEGLMEDHLAVGVPELGSGLWRPEHISAVCVQEHLRRGHPALGDERGDLRRPLVRVLDAHSDPSHQVCLHCPTSRRQWRGYASRIDSSCNAGYAF